MALAPHPTRAFGLQDLLQAPEDGYRYEVVDGALVVNAAPSWRHQHVVARMLELLAPAAPAGVLVLPSPAWQIGPDQVPQPDVVVVRASDLGEHAVEGTPLLVVEVLSPANRAHDLGRKRELYAAAGCPAYWIVDPPAHSVLVLERQGGQYAERCTAVGDDSVVVDEPFAIRFRPSDLTSR